MSFTLKQKKIIRKVYIQKIEKFFSNLIIDRIYLTNNVIKNSKVIIYCNVHLFVQQIERCDDISKNLTFEKIINVCFFEIVKEWYNSLIKSLQNVIFKESVTLFCAHLTNRFDEKQWANTQRWLEKQEQQQKETRIEKKRAKVFVCKRCFVKFSSNIKLHQHVQNHHQKKSSIISSFISSLTSFSTFFIILSIFIKSILIAIFFATSKKSIFWTKITSKSITSSKSSRLSFSIFESLKNASIIFASTSTLTTTRFYMTMNDLFVMFVEKSKSLNLIHRQKNSFFSHSKQSSKLVIFYQICITSYFLTSFNSFKFNILSKSNFCLFIQINVIRRHTLFCEQNINFASRCASLCKNLNYFLNICRRCKQFFEFENQFHKHFRHCKKNVKCHVFARNLVVVWRKL